MGHQRPHCARRGARRTARRLPTRTATCWPTATWSTSASCSRRASALTDEWCGYFAQDNFRKAGLDKDLQAGFWAVDDVRDYCKYTYARHPKQILKWIWADGTWQVLKDYHAHRGALRRWLDYAAVSAGGALDIRPGDIVIVDWNRDGTADHIAIAQSYDPATSTLVTVGGNDSGLVLDAKPKFDSKGERKLGGESAEDKAAREEREAATGQSLKPAGKFPRRGRSGRPERGGQQLRGHARRQAAGQDLRGRAASLVDFEDHPYDGTNQEKPPPPLKP